MHGPDILTPPPTLCKTTFVMAGTCKGKEHITLGVMWSPLNAMYLTCITIASNVLALSFGCYQNDAEADAPSSKLLVMAFVLQILLN